MRTLSGNTLSPGETVAVDVAYWAPQANQADQIDVYYAADAQNPAWVLVGTITPPAVSSTQDDVGTVQYTLPTGPLQVVRAAYRFAGIGPTPCSTAGFTADQLAASYDDHDDLVFAVGSPTDTATPSVSLVYPANGGVVSGDVGIEASVTDNVGVAQVRFLVDGSLLDTVTSPPYATLWPAGLIADGTHQIQVRAYDTSGNYADAGPITVTVQNVPNASFDASWGTPLCAAVASFCDTGPALVVGRGPVGPEPGAPNTLLASCQDGQAGAFHVDESLDSLKVSSLDGLSFQPGSRVKVEASVFAYTAFSDDALDLFYARNPAAPVWRWFATLHPPGPGAQVLSAEYTLPASAFQVVRGVYRFGGSGPTTCPTSSLDAAGLAQSFDDTDDVAFAVSFPPNATYDSKLGAPSCGPGYYCDSGTLLDGRANLGPEPDHPNTLDGCADGTAGTYHVDESVDRIAVLAADGSPLRAGTTATLQVTVFAGSDYARDHVYVYLSDSPASGQPSWTYLTTLSPPGSGVQVVSADLPLAAAGQKAVRVHLAHDTSFLPAPSACGTTGGTSTVDDQDDLVFTVQP